MKQIISNTQLLRLLLPLLALCTTKAHVSLFRVARRPKLQSNNAVLYNMELFLTTWDASSYITMHHAPSIALTQRNDGYFDSLGLEKDASPVSFVLLFGLLFLLLGSPLLASFSLPSLSKSIRPLQSMLLIHVPKLMKLCSVGKDVFVTKFLPFTNESIRKMLLMEFWRSAWMFFWKKTKRVWTKLSRFVSSCESSYCPEWLRCIPLLVDKYVSEDLVRPLKKMFEKSVETGAWRLCKAVVDFVARFWSRSGSRPDA